MKKLVISVDLRRYQRGSASTQGLTLLELIVYIGIATIVLIAFSGILLGFVQSWGKSRARARVDENLRFAIQAIQESAASADEILIPSSGGSDTLTLAMPPSSGDNQTLYGWAWSGSDDPSGKTGTGTISSSGTSVTGAGTLFQSELAVGDTIAAAGESRGVASITDNFNLTVNAAFSANLPLGTAFTYSKKAGIGWISFNYKNAPTDTCATGKADPFDCEQDDDTIRAQGTGTISSSSTTVTGVGTKFLSELDPGDTLFAGTQSAIVTAVTDDATLTTDVAFSPALASNTVFYYIKTNLFDNYQVRRTAGIISGYAINCPDNASAPDKPCLPISFNCRDAINYDPQACGLSDYRVTVDGNGVYRGFAWGGDVLGWISFNCVNTDSCFTASPPGTNPCGGDAGDWKVCETKTATGAELHGWAWSENIGWISFHCADRGVCATSDYKVISVLGGATRTFTVDVAGRVTRQDGTGGAVPLTASNVTFEKCTGWANYFEHFANPPAVRSGVRVCFAAKYSGIGANLFPYRAEQQLSIALR